MAFAWDDSCITEKRLWFRFISNTGHEVNGQLLLRCQIKNTRHFPICTLEKLCPSFAGFFSYLPNKKGFPDGSDSKESACQGRRCGFNCLENPMDRGTFFIRQSVKTITYLLKKTNISLIQTFNVLLFYSLLFCYQTTSEKERNGHTNVPLFSTEFYVTRI